MLQGLLLQMHAPSPHRSRRGQLLRIDHANCVTRYSSCVDDDARGHFFAFTPHVVVVRQQRSEFDT